MSKQSGLGDNLYIGGANVSGDIQALGRISGGPATGDFTGIDKHAHERKGLIRDGGIDFTSFFNPGPAADAAHLVLSALPTTDQYVTYCRGTSLGSPAAATVAKQTNYDGNRSDNGEFHFTINTLSNGYGLEWGRQLTAGRRSDSSATNGSSVDLGSASPGAFGLQAYLHVFSFTGTSVTIKIQESSDNGSGDAFADVTGGGFTVVSSAPTAERIATAAIDVERYLRVVTTGTFSECTFAVMAVRNDTAVSF